LRYLRATFCFFVPLLTVFGTALPVSPAFYCLEFPVNARGAAMGGADASILSGVDAVARNPARLAFLKNCEVGFGYFSPGPGIHGGALSFSPAQKGRISVAFHLLYFGTSGIDETNNIGALTGNKFSKTDLAASVTVSRKFSGTAAFGLSVKALYSGLAGLAATGVAMDSGITWSMLLPGLKAAAVIRNWGPPVSGYWEGEARLPTTAALSVSADLWHGIVLVGLETDFGVNRSAVVRSGLELKPSKPLALRLGYSVGVGGWDGAWRREPSPSVGFGIRLGGCNFDYGWTQMRYLGMQNYLSLKMIF